MLSARPQHRTQRDTLVKADQPAAIFYGQRQQIQIGQLVVDVYVSMVKIVVIEQTDFIG